jgi:hypothetical protein
MATASFRRSFWFRCLVLAIFLQGWVAPLGAVNHHPEIYAATALTKTTTTTRIRPGQSRLRYSSSNNNDNNSNKNNNNNMKRNTNRDAVAPLSAMADESAIVHPATVAAAAEDHPDPEITIKKTLLCIRHGTSKANECMSEPGNEWGDSTFYDDIALIDSPLSERGIHQVQTALPRQFHDNPKLLNLLQEAQLVVISPLTRCLQTYLYGVEPVLRQQKRKNSIPILAQSLLTGTSLYYF